MPNLAENFATPADMNEKLPVVPEALQTLAKNRELRLKIQGDCMSPLLESGTGVRVKGAKFYWPGDCLVFAGADGRLTAHRLLGYYYKQRQIRYLTQADRAKRPDRYILKRHIIGKICGGECDPRLAKAPPLHRLRAGGKFARYCLERIWIKIHFCDLVHRNCLKKITSAVDLDV
jgi:hypothetical protein